MIKRTILFLTPLLLPLFAAAQQEVKWKAAGKELGDNLHEIVVEATIADGWHMYDLGPYKDPGPNPTAITVVSAVGATAEGKSYEIDKPIEEYDPIFRMDIGTYQKKARFGQKIKINAERATVKLAVEWMACTEFSCTPLLDTLLTITFQGAPIEAVATVTTSGWGEAAEAVEELQAAEATIGAPEEESGGSLWALILEAVLWGFAALLTPCVFPLIPLTISFFMKGGDKPAIARARAGLFGLFIILLYTLPIAVIILTTLVVGGESVTADIFNWLSTHWLPNILFFTVFMIFAASFFGAFDITLPSSLVNKSDRNAEKKGLAGIFFMALTLVLVSFSCTGPIVGSVLIKSTAGMFWEPIVTMLAFSVAFALPFTLLAMFPSVLKKLPKSGGWLNSVKVTLGFIEVALGLKFLSVADQTYHWGILDREVYLAIWIVVFILLGFYLLGKLRFKHDDELKYITVPRLALAIASFTFAMYLIPGMWGAPLKGLSGYLPPMHTQDFVVGDGGNVAAVKHKSEAKYSDFLYLPHGLTGYFDLEEGEAAARKAGKPLFVDVTGHGCVNCREMEARVWSDPRVLALLRNEYVIVALYTDDKTPLPQSEWVVAGNGKTLKDLGRINSYTARTKWGVNAQPNYIILDGNGGLLAPPRGYNLDIEGFLEFLETGIREYKK